VFGLQVVVVVVAVAVQRVTVQVSRGNGSSGEEREEVMDRGFGSGREFSDQE
jgi:hypothetical protein